MINRVYNTQGGTGSPRPQTTATVNGAVETDFSELISQYKEKLVERINNNSEQKFQIGNAEYSIKEWDKLMARIDKAEEVLEAEMQEREERIAEEEMQKEISIDRL